MLDEARLPRSSGHVGGAVQLRVDIAFDDPAGGENVVGPVRLDRGRTLVEGGVEPDHRRLLAPPDGNLLVMDGGNGVCISYQGYDRFAAVADLGIGKDRLIFDMRVDPESVIARHVGRSEHPDEAGVSLVEACKVADLELRPRVG